MAQVTTLPIISRTDVCGEAIGKGLFVKKNDTTGKMMVCASGIADGVSLSATQADGDTLTYAVPGSGAQVMMAAAVTNTAVPIKPTTGGKGTPCDTDQDAIGAWPQGKITSAGGVSLVDVQVAKGYYAKT